VSVEDSIRDFYDTTGWATDEDGRTLDERLFTDPRPAARAYATMTRRRLLAHLPNSGERLLDAGSGPVQLPEYVEYGERFERHVCVDISERALEGARRRLGARGEYVQASLLDLPFSADHFDAAVSSHVLYHVVAEDQERAVRELLRVVRPDAPVLIVYTHDPLKPVRDLLRPLKRRLRGAPPSSLYVHGHPLRWWHRFADVADVQLVPFALLRHDQSAHIPERLLAQTLRAAAHAEERLPRLALRVAAYPLVVLRKR
jgi:SAM-dependent methyltransferase